MRLDVSVEANPITSYKVEKTVAIANVVLMAHRLIRVGASGYAT